MPRSAGAGCGHADRGRIHVDPDHALAAPTQIAVEPHPDRFVEEVGPERGPVARRQPALEQPPVDGVAVPPPEGLEALEVESVAALVDRATLPSFGPPVGGED
jgi:hypothetical protein